MTPYPDDAPRFARSGVSASIGKCTEPIKTHVPEVTSDEFRRLAASLGCSTSELLRDLVCLAVHGQTFGELSAAEKKRVLMGGPESDHIMARLGALAKSFAGKRLGPPESNNPEDTP